MPAIDLGRIALHYADAGAGDPPVLLLHELGGSGASFAALTAALAAGRRVIAPDLRGAGRSEKTVHPFTLHDAADDILALLDRLAIARVDALGAALGCYVATSLAARHPDRVRRVLLCAVAPGIDARTASYLTERAAAVRAQGMRVAADTSLNNAFPDAHADIRACYRPRWIANDPAAFARLSQALAAHAMTADDWGRITQPCLVLSGAHDFIWSPETGREVAALIPGARFDVLRAAGHFPHLQSPAELAARASAFFA